MFADDTNISTQDTTKYEKQERLNDNFENVHQWLLANKFTLTKQKTEYMIIGSRQHISNIITDPKIELGESVIKRVNKCKTLGIIIDEHLSWKDQIQNVVTKVSKGNRNVASNKTVRFQINIVENIYINTLPLCYHTLTIVAWFGTTAANT